MLREASFAQRVRDDRLILNRIERARGVDESPTRGEQVQPSTSTSGRLSHAP